MTVSPTCSDEGSGVACRETLRRSTVRCGQRFKAAWGRLPRRQIVMSPQRIGNVAWQRVKPTGRAEKREPAGKRAWVDFGLLARC